jgi:hypothetical protein
MFLCASLVIIPHKNYDYAFGYIYQEGTFFKGREYKIIDLTSKHCS